MWFVLNKHVLLLLKLVKERDVWNKRLVNGIYKTKYLIESLKYKHTIKYIENGGWHFVYGWSVHCSSKNRTHSH
jgi:hypothetical protein